MSTRKKYPNEDGDAAPSGSEGGYAEALAAAYKKALHTYGGRDYVTGIDIGRKYSGGNPTAVRAVRIHVREKRDESVLEAAEIFPKQIDGVPVDVIQATYRVQRGAVEVSPERTGRMDPIQPGISVGHPTVTAGTLGAIVFDSTSGAPCLLSNWHVLVGGNAARAGDAIVQPGNADGGRVPQDTVAKLERWVLGPDGDAAIARLTNAREVSDAQFESMVRIVAARMPAEDEIVEKSGRTTGVTRGRVDGVGRYYVEYRDRGEVGIDGFKIVATTPGNPNDEEISSGGDSGSLWYATSDRAGVGLHFAGETDADPREEHALACFLPRVLSVLNVTLMGEQREEAAGAEPSVLADIQRRLRELERLMRSSLSLSREAAPAECHGHVMDSESLGGRELSRDAIESIVVGEIKARSGFHRVTGRTSLADAIGADAEWKRGLHRRIERRLGAKGSGMRRLGPRDFESFDAVADIVDAIHADQA